MERTEQSSASGDEVRGRLPGVDLRLHVAQAPYRLAHALSPGRTGIRLSGVPVSANCRGRRITSSDLGIDFAERHTRVRVVGRSIAQLHARFLPRRKRLLRALKA